MEGLAAVPCGWVGLSVASTWGSGGSSHGEGEFLGAVSEGRTWEGHAVPGKACEPTRGGPMVNPGNNDRVVVPPTRRVTHTEHHPLGETVKEEFKPSKGPASRPSMGKKGRKNCNQRIQ